MKLYIKRVHPDAVLPNFAHPNDAGMDLCAAAEITILPGARAQVSTGLAFQIPDGYVGLVWDKSGVSHKGGLKTLGGVIDAGYRGEVMVGILNTSAEAYTFLPGQKVAQLLIQKVEHPEIEEVADLEGSARGDSGFGSTGK